MDPRAAASYYGWRLGLVAGLFGVLQVLVMVDAALAGDGALATVQHAMRDGAYPFGEVSALAIVLLATYVAAMVSGAVMLWLADRAGRLAVAASGTPRAGEMAGARVALVSGGVWIVFSLVVVGLVHADGTVSGVFTTDPGGPLNVAELIALLAQEAIAVLIGFALASLVGHHAAGQVSRRASLPWQ